MRRAAPIPIGADGYRCAQPILRLRALEQSDWAKEQFSEEFLKVFLAIKHTEYREFMGEVGEQDWRWYLTHA